MNRKLIHNWGINDADYVVEQMINGKRIRCPFHRVWQSMIKRCHSKKCQEKQPTYVGCEIILDWKYFMTFKAWMETQDWKERHLDKDLLGNKFYSPKTCCFVELWLNNLFNDNTANRGKYPIGVNWSKYHHKFVSKVKINGRNKFLGYFDTPEEAHAAYCKAKRQHIQNLMTDYPDQRIKEAVLMKATKLLLK